MASLIPVFCFFALICHIGVECTIFSMKAATRGYTKGVRETEGNLNLQLTMDQYHRGKRCVKVMLIEQTEPLRKLEEITVSCTSEKWSAIDSMVNYGDTIHIQTKDKVAEWAVFDLGTRCIQHIYKDNGVYLLGKEETTFNRKECDKVIRTATPYKCPQTSYSYGSQGTHTSIPSPTQVNDGVSVGNGVGSPSIQNPGSSTNSQDSGVNKYGYYIVSRMGTDYIPAKREVDNAQFVSEE